MPPLVRCKRFRYALCNRLRSVAERRPRIQRLPEHSETNPYVDQRPVHPLAGSTATRSLRALLIGLLTLGLSCLAPASAQAATATNNPGFTANVMAPLWVSDTDMPAFEAQIKTAKEYGVDAVSVDIWWGKVETSDQVFNWTYYDNLFAKIKAQGLKIVPILSFHTCGGNVGDECNFPIPGWLGGKYTGATLNGLTLDGNGLKYKSEQGNYSSETIQAWADPLVVGEYSAFATAFKTKYGTAYASDFQEINVSLGPAGGTRFPKYNSHDTGAGYPSRGALQAYSPLAVADFRTSIMAKYGTLAANTAWGSSLTSRLPRSTRPRTRASSSGLRRLQEHPLRQGLHRLVQPEPDHPRQDRP